MCALLRHKRSYQSLSFPSTNFQKDRTNERRPFLRVMSVVLILNVHTDQSKNQSCRICDECSKGTDSPALLISIFLIKMLHSVFTLSVCSSRAESKCSQRQQKALSSTVHRLSESLKQLQQENTALREELSTDSPAGGLKGFSPQNTKH